MRVDHIYKRSTSSMGQLLSLVNVFSASAMYAAARGTSACTQHKSSNCCNAPLVSHMLPHSHSAALAHSLS